MRFTQRVYDRVQKRERELFLRALNIGVVGSGISGLSAAWLLSRRHRVTVIEANQHIGGHANTVDVRAPGGKLVPIDTGFIVSNPETYKNFFALMDYLGVTMDDSEMSFSISSRHGAFEYSGHSLWHLLGAARQWPDPRHWRMVYDLVRFYRTAERDAADLPVHETLGSFLKKHNYSTSFIANHILPIAGAIWSSGTADIAQYPVRAFVKFFVNHRLFALGSRPIWRTVKGGSRDYVRKLFADGAFSVLTGQAVTAVRRHADRVDVAGANGFRQSFDHIVIATHADQALRLLADPSEAEGGLLSNFRTSENTAVLHRDATLMPFARRFWSAWNYHGGPADGGLVRVTYWMNALQKLQSSDQHFVSLNPPRQPKPELVDGTYLYRHPIFDTAALSAQRDLWSLQGVNRTWFAGAWFGSGFHEDGLQAGLAVAEQLGGTKRPWTIAGESDRIHVKPIDIAPETPLLRAAE
jgi:uncharacterized protein